MKKVFQDAKDKYVAANVVYANGSNELFYDEEFTDSVSADDLKDLFYKNVVAVKNGTAYTAKSMTSAGVVDFGFPS